MYYFIINPNARSRMGIAVWKELKEILLEKGVPFREFITKNSIEAQEIVKKISSLGYPVSVVVLGGDGTLHRVLSSLNNQNHVTLGYIPIGSSNDFARGMRWSRDFKERLQRLLEASDFCQIDYGCLESENEKEKFIVSAGVGFDAAVCEMANHSKIKKLLNRFKLGKLTYLQIGLSALWKTPLFEAELILDYKKYSYDEVLFISVHNLPYEGGGLPFCPDADPQDGFLDVCVVAGLSKKRMPGVLMKVPSGKHINCENVYIHRCKTITVQLQQPQYIHMDGEVPGKRSKIIISVTDNQIKMI